MLGDKRRMPLHWCLTAIIWRLRGCQTLANEISRVVQNGSEALLGQIAPLTLFQLKPASKARAGQIGEKFIEVTHTRII